MISTIKNVHENVENSFFIDSTVCDQGVKPGKNDKLDTKESKSAGKSSSFFSSMIFSNSNNPKPKTLSISNK